MLPDFPISFNAPIGATLFARGLTDFAAVARYIQALPYGRNSDRTRPELVLEEGRGTCSSKHAFLRMVAVESGHPEVKLVMGLYNMNAVNTPGIGNALVEAGLAFIPEAHCYLKWQGNRIDLTNTQSDIHRIEEDILSETEIEAWQVGEWKVNAHQQFLRNWIGEVGLDIGFEEVWAVREGCIANLST